MPALGVAALLVAPNAAANPIDDFTTSTPAASGWWLNAASTSFLQAVSSSFEDFVIAAVHRRTTTIRRFANPDRASQFSEQTSSEFEFIALSFTSMGGSGGDGRSGSPGGSLFTISTPGGGGGAAMPPGLLALLMAGFPGSADFTLNDSLGLGSGLGTGGGLGLAGGMGAGGGSAVPEPGTTALLATGLSVLAVRRFRHARRRP
jgi:hypothetical protein